VSAKRGWHIRFTPTSASWINQIERFFALLTERALKRGVFRSVAELEKATKAYIRVFLRPPPLFWSFPLARLDSTILTAKRLKSASR
jgi:hypothetical protein